MTSYARTATKGAFVKGTGPETQLQLIHSINASIEVRAAPVRAARVSVTMRLAESLYKREVIIGSGQHRLGRAVRLAMLRYVIKSLVGTSIIG